MKKVLWMAVCAALVTAVTVNAATLTLAIKSAGVSEVTVTPGTAVPISITGVLSGEATDGLALWGVDATNSAGTDSYDAPAGNMQAFKKNAGLTNPAGYGGTASGAALLQIGGGQNTINYHGSTPAYPTGTVVEAVAAAEEALATGTLVTTGLLDGADVTVTIANGFANTLNAAQAGPVYAVSPATVALGAPTLTVHIRAGNVPPVITAKASVATHGTAPGTEVSLDLAAVAVEPRKIVSGDAKANAFLRVTFDKPMASASVTANPAIAGIAAVVESGAIVKVTLPSGATDETCYRISLAGSVAGDGGVAAAAENFCVCYNEGDVNRTAPVNVFDKQAVTSTANWSKTAPGTATNPEADITRDGVVNVFDKQAVTSTANWNKSPAACP